MKARPSLKARGVQLLAQREHSRTELRRKLLRHAREDEAQARAAELAAASLSDAPSHALPAPRPDPQPDPPSMTRSGAHAAEPRGAVQHPPGPGPSDAAAGALPVTPESAVDAALDWLEARHYLDATRFVESRVHARASRYGNLRIRQELAQHGLSLSPEAGESLKASEFERAREVWRRKYGEPAADAAGRARQASFLAGRGFSSSVIRRVVQGDDDD